MSVTVLVTQVRSSLPGGRPWVELPRFLVRSFQFSLGIYTRPMDVIDRPLCSDLERVKSLTPRLTMRVSLAPHCSGLRCGRLGLNKPNGYLLGSYRIATAPEPNSSRLTSLKSTRFDSPANNVSPWPASLGCTTNSYSSINPSSANASGSFTPPVNIPLPGSPFSC